MRRIIISRRPVVGVMDMDVLLIETTHVHVPHPPFNHHDPLAHMDVDLPADVRDVDIDCLCLHCANLMVVVTLLYRTQSFKTELFGLAGRQCCGMSFIMKLIP